MSERDKLFKSILVVTHVPHYRDAGRFCAYSPYVREIDIWASLFETVDIAAPFRNQEAPSDVTSFERSNIRLIPQREAGGETFLAKIRLVLSAPLMAWELSKAMRHADAIHVRCPGNLGLLGTLLGPLFSKKLVAKFAGQWSPGGNEAWSTRFNRWLLSSRWWHGPVTVYGRWDNQPAHVVPFFSSAFTDAQIQRARTAGKTVSKDLRKILFVGRLSASKNVDVLLRSLSQLRAEHIPFEAVVIGDGPEFNNLQKLTSALGLGDLVEFTGGVSSDRVTEFLERSGILVLASETEGWPKAIVEAMAFGLVTIGSNVGLIPEMMGEGRGLIVPVRDVGLLTEALRKVLTAPDDYAEMRLRAATWACQFSLEYLRDSLRSMLERNWSSSNVTDLELAGSGKAGVRHAPR
jgi:glycosyltransferase involved in cell wall biosynthesis